MIQVIVLRGLPASGKSTWAREQLARHPGRYKRVNKDDLRAMLDAGRHSKVNERFVERLRDEIVLRAIDAGFHVLVDDTNLAPRHERHLRELVRGQAEVVVKTFDITVEEAIKRDLARPVSVGERVIRRMWRDHIAPEVAERVESIEGLPEAIIVDLDGTLAVIDHRNPYDAGRCEEDGLNPVVAGIAAAHELVLCSGRMETFRAETERWLAAHGIAYEALFMRADGDLRKDSVVKRELFDKHIRGHWNIRFVLDDRNQVVDMWRSLGLVCLQVAEGDF